MFHSFYRTVVGPDRTRMFDRLGRFKVPVYGAALVYGFVWSVVGSVEFVTKEHPDGWWVLIFVATFLPWVVLVRSPLYAWRLAAVSMYFVAGLIDWTGVGDFQYWTAAPLLILVTFYYSRGVVVWATLLSMLVVNFSESQHHEYALFIPLVTGAIFAFGVRGRAEKQLEEERNAKIALEERARIAREMHDVVAHHMSMVVVRCETAPYRLKGLSEEAEKEFGELGEAARGAITDMQRLLGVLRADGETPEREPQPGISRIPELVRPGDEAEVEVDDVPEAVSLTAYRIVQEALTNATRHAPGSKASVHVRTQGRELDVVVINTSGGPSRGGGGGRGITGMRERVAVHGGTLTVKATDSGGFMVRARIPLGDK